MRSVSADRAFRGGRELRAASPHVGDGGYVGVMGSGGGGDDDAPPGADAGHPPWPWRFSETL
jgi:hypothetical protein